MNELDNQVVIITGAGSGLGKATAIQFAKAGAALVICGRRTAKIKAVEQEIKLFHSHVLAVTADVSLEDDVNRLIKDALSTYGKIDVLINNAAVFEQHDIVDASLESWNYQMNNNVTSAFLMMKECIPVMRKQKNGKIINLTSSLAHKGAPGFGPYGASKAALEVLTNSVDEEENRHGINICAFDPGVMKTEMQATGVNPSTVASVLVRLAEPNQRYTGEVLHVDQFVE